MNTWCFQEGGKIRITHPEKYDYLSGLIPERYSDRSFRIFASFASIVKPANSGLYFFARIIRRNIDDRRRYEQIKRELAAKEWPDMNAYADARTEVIESIIAAEQASGEISR